MKNPLGLFSHHISERAVFDGTQYNLPLGKKNLISLFNYSSLLLSSLEI